MVEASFRQSFVQSYRWALAGVVAALVLSLDGLSITEPTTYLVGVPYFLAVVGVGAVLDYIIHRVIFASHSVESKKERRR